MNRDSDRSGRLPTRRLSGSGTCGCLRPSVAIFLALALLAARSASAQADSTQVTVSSKAFTENIILGSVLRQLAEGAGAQARHKRALGGTGLVFTDLTTGGTDAYVEYTGTILKELLAGEGLETPDDARAYLAERGIVMSRPLGFNNTYVLGMRRDRAAELGIEKVSDLRDHPDLRLRFNNEFQERSDGWPAVKAFYDLPHTDVGGMEHTLALAAVGSRQADVTDVYATDAEIETYDLVALEDDRGFFPPYDAVILYREDLEERAPAVVEAWRELEGAIDEEQMIALNTAALVGGRDEAAVAAEYVREKFWAGATAAGHSLWDRLARTTAQHLLLVGAAMGLGILTAIPLGILATWHIGAERTILPTVGLIQTIPSLALLALMIPFLRTGPVPAIVALWLYSLLPMVRNTHAGLVGIPRPLRESARALGLTPWQRLTKVELPLAMPNILTGIKTSAVITVGFATLGAFINAGGYGEPILSGLRRLGTDRGMQLIYEGAIPAAVMALIVQFGLDGVSRLIIPRGLR